MSSRGVGLALAALLSGSVGWQPRSLNFLEVQSNVSEAASAINAHHDQIRFERHQALLQYRHIAPSGALETLVERLTSPETGEYMFQGVRTDAGLLTNIILVIGPIAADSHSRRMLEEHRDKIVFLGMSSLEDYPLPPPNPFSAQFPADEYVGLFPGFLNMYRDPDQIYPKDVKTVLLSQSDFNLPHVRRVDETTVRCSEGNLCDVDSPVKSAWFGHRGNEWTSTSGSDVTSKVQELRAQGTSTLQVSLASFWDPAPGEPKELVIEFEDLPKEKEFKYDFIMSGSNQDIDHDCVGWSSFAKNWSFAKEAFDVMCKEYNLTGVVVAARKDEQACSLPESCNGLITETNYLDQNGFFDYMKQSRFLFLPQVHDASPRVAPQGLAHNLPLLMNRNIIGGWKYLNDATGESFHDMSDFRQSLETLLSKAKRGQYAPQKYILENAGNEIAGTKFKNFIEEHFADSVKLPPGTKWLTPA